MSGWFDHAACRGQAHLFFPDIPLHDPAYAQWEEVSAIAAKPVCAECPVFAECAAMAFDTDQTPATSRGVMAGLTRWEREWIRSNPDQAKALSRRLDSEGIDPISLSLAVLRVGMVPALLEATPEESAKRYGAPLWVARRWHELAGPATRAAMSTKGSPWARAIRIALHREPDRWFSAVELLDAYATLIPGERLAAKRSTAGNRAMSDRTAASSIINAAIYAGIKQGVFQRRKIGNRLYIRAAKAHARAA